MNSDISRSEDIHTPDRRALLAGIGGLAAGALLAGKANAGPLNPPAGPVASTYKTLSEVEPRIALSQTNTAGDSRALFVINQPGSYYLTGNITTPTDRTAAILIPLGVSGVTIDLGGFTIDANGRNGISSDGGNTPFPVFNNSITIRNGVIRNFLDYGIRSDFQPQSFPDVASPAMTIENVRVTTSVGNGLGIGIRAGRDAVVRDCSVYAAKVGIQTGLNSRVSRCTVSAASVNGFIIGAASTVDNCLAVGTSLIAVGPAPGAGFVLASGSTITNSLSRTNQGVGFVLADQCVAQSCSATDNAIGGFVAKNASSILDCIATTNNATGIGILMEGNGLVSRAQVFGGVAGIRLFFGGNRVERSKIGNAENAILSEGIDTIVENSMNAAALGVGNGITINGSDAYVDGNYIYAFNRGIELNTSRGVVTRNRLHFLGTPIAGAGAGGAMVGPLVTNAAAATNPLANTLQ